MTLGAIPKTCLKCDAPELQVRRKSSYVTYDLKFTRNGIKRYVVRYHYSRYRCSECHAETSTYSSGVLYGLNLRSFVVYLMIELRLSNQKAAEHASLLFDLPLDAPKAFHMKSAMAEKYLPTYRDILRQIAKGTLIHADETKGVVKGGGHYIWVFANLTTVAYVYAESRESRRTSAHLIHYIAAISTDMGIKRLESHRDWLSTPVSMSGQNLAMPATADNTLRLLLCWRFRRSGHRRIRRGLIKSDGGVLLLAGATTGDLA